MHRDIELIIEAWFFFISLVNAARINEFNISSIMRCILPYHETNPFVSFVSLLKLDEKTASMDTALWTFLTPLKKSRHPLEVETLVQRCIKDRGLLEFVCSMVQTFAQTPHAPPFKTLFSFYASVVLRIVQAMPTLNLEFSMVMLPYLLDGLKAKASPDFQLSTYMILSQISSRAELSQDAVSSLTIAMVQHYSKPHATQMLLCMVYLAQSQQSFQELPKKALKPLLKIPDLGASLIDISQKYNAERFLRAFLLKLIHCR